MQTGSQRNNYNSNVFFCIIVTNIFKISLSMKKHFTTILILFFVAVNTHAQEYFEKYYSTYSYYMHSKKITFSNEKALYLLSYSDPSGEYGSQTYFISKIDSSGNLLWQKNIQSDDHDIGHTDADFELSPDSFIYCAINPIACIDDGSIIKMDRNGNIIWDRKYDLNISYPGSKFYAICSTKNSDQIIGGSIAWTNCVPQCPYICRMAPDGSTIWEATWLTQYPGESINKIEAFQDSTYLVHLSSLTVQINDSGQIVSSIFPNGKFIPIDTGGYIVFDEHSISRITDSLIVTWQSPYYADLFIHDLTFDSTSNYYVTGRKDTCKGEMFVSKIDSTGNIVYTKLYGGDLFDEGSVIGMLQEGQLVAAGSHQIHKWALPSDHYYDCQKFLSYTAEVLLVKLKTVPLSFSQCESSTGKYTVCDNDSMVLNAPSGYSYAWNTGSTTQSILIDTSGSYIVEISDSLNNSEILPAFNLFHYPTPMLPHFPDSILLQCTGAFDICLEMPYSSSIYDRDYEWFRSGSNWANIPIIFDINGLQTGTYFCISSNLCGIDTSGNIILQNGQPIVSLGNDTTLCIPNSLLLTAGTNIYHYLWQDGSTLPSFLATSTIADSLYFHVTKSDFQHCSTVDSILIVFDVCTSSSHTNLSENISIFPNPTMSNLFVSFNNNITIHTVNIFDMYGIKRRVNYFSIGKDAILELQTNDLTSGIYILEIISDTQKSVKYFIKE